MEIGDLRLGTKDTFQVTKVDEALLKWATKICDSRYYTMKDLADRRAEELACGTPRKHLTRYVPCENHECESRMGLGDEVLVVDLNPSNRRVFCSGSCCRQYAAFWKDKARRDFKQGTNNPDRKRRRR